MSRPANKTIFIVCEGGGTEPNYLGSIRDIIIEKGLNVEITISPLPKNEAEKEFRLRANAKRRELKKIKEEEESKLKKYEIAGKFSAQPVRYVRDAQMRLEDGAFDEVWAVYDKNGHPKHAEAFDLAANIVNGKKVNIAFSSIAFEYWIILHFQQLNYVFLKSQCREGEELLNCGTNTDRNDCQGSRCICGYLKIHNLLPDYSKSMRNLYQLLESNVYTAIDNAVWLRNNIPLQEKGKPIYELNPYLNLDHLIFSLLQLPLDLTWFDNNDEINTDGISFKIERNANTLRILTKSTNIGRRFILNEGSFLLSDSLGTLYPLSERKTLDNTEIVMKFDLNEFQELNPIFILYKTIGETYFIGDLS